MKLEIIKVPSWNRPKYQLRTEWFVTNKKYHSNQILIIIR